MDFGLNGKHVIVVGGTKGLGKAVCKLFAEEGANVAIVSRHQAACDAVAEELHNTYGVKTVGITCDMGDDHCGDILFEKALNAFDSLDVLVNNAGIWPQAYVVDMKEEDFRHTLNVNLVSPFILCRNFARYLLAQHRTGKIINVVSQAVFHGSTTGHAHYAASKGGLVTFTISLARELAPYGINVNAVAPGIMDTPMMHEILCQKREYYQSRIPLGREAQPEEVGYSVVFLASNKSDYLTGITIDATGGMLMR
ncbi:3-oxoacyl-ACP reductase [Megasphaera cerevisiae DSM 20462]|uniref:3-oxoacyl-ACP reductase n=1 Tax=Megasphaera cerevisiae DSM 20462 TaxID=1122219 RepID=A0A0J6WUP7_9FIRM|nr:SDR family NAD(P)-dependent oxidoreductase [Megasphaera cerevisiae]KMO85908.1 3-oxoacyl-ACP reductase [Megasphaera cerevisiae DSM 20462]MCI1750245.1 SDR family oxidoreductase [Megasphaera cerevisiae]OKY52328.1 3-oxoacyl-ACP reductase [Megasphaera cerevisiae]SKA07790.1 3-oxoacyl-[acyl-carrier protein] reductase [Megasphaera cerevisiae DSM 20462]